MTKQQLLNDLAKQIIADDICPELAAQATQLVMGEGNSDAKVVLIGEAPGKREDLQGRPFIGASGKFLDVMLESIGLGRADIYITNIVKYRPPDNRDPSAAEKDTFWPYLLRQLEIIEPQLIVTLGRHSMSMFLPGAEIKDMHGQLVEISLSGQTYQFLPLYHPALALYNGSKRAILLEDFQKIASVVDAG